MHPKAEAAEVKSKIAKEAKHREYSELLALEAAHGLKYQHIRNMGDDFNPLPHGGVTLAYRSVGIKKLGDSGRRFIEVSNAICSDKDSYSRLEGRRRAAFAFNRGQRVTFRIPADVSASEFLREIFAAQLDGVFQQRCEWTVKGRMFDLQMEVQKLNRMFKNGEE